MITIKSFIPDSDSSQLPEPTHKAMVSTATFKGLSISISVVDVRDVAAHTNVPIGRTLIWPASYAVRLDSFEIQRQQVIAETLKARLIVIELPGVGINMAAEMPLAHKLSLLTGNFTPSAQAMLGALFEIVSFGDGDEIEFLLYSQGAALGVAMIAELGNNTFNVQLKIPRVTIIEAVNDQPWHALPLLAAIRSEDQYADRYLNDNKAYPWLVRPTNVTAAKKRRNRKQQINLLLAGAGLRRPFIPILLKAIKEDRLHNTTGIRSARIDIIKFNASRVSRLEKNSHSIKQLTATMSAELVSLTIVSAPEGQSGYHHPAIHSMPIMETISRELLK
ncbi:hypothetical protein H7Y40_00825 [Pedobacter sp.]|nr:hypothetical protein [Candidatus Saccharibacteria bacterium]